MRKIPYWSDGWPCGSPQKEWDKRMTASIEGLIFPNDKIDNIINQASDGELKIQYHPHKSNNNRHHLGDIIFIINYLVYIAKSSKSKINKITFVKNEFMKVKWASENSFIQNRFKNEEKGNTPVSWDKLKDAVDSVMKKNNEEDEWRWANLYWDTYRYNCFWKTLEELVEIIDSPIELRCITENDWTKNSCENLFLDSYSIKYILGLGGERCWKETALEFLLLNKDLPLLKAKKIWKKENLGSNSITHCLKGNSNNAEQYVQSILACCKDNSLQAPHNFKVKSPITTHYDKNMLGPTLEGSLKQWLEAMFISKYYIGADTGISHLAEMINIPTLILYSTKAHNALRGNYDEKGNFHPTKSCDQSWVNLYPNSKEEVISCEDDLCPAIDKFESHLDHWAWANSQTD